MEAVKQELAFKIKNDLKTHLLSDLPDKMPSRYDRYIQNRIDSSISRLSDLIRLFYSSKTEHELLELKIKIEASISEIRTQRKMYSIENWTTGYFESHYTRVPYSYGESWKAEADNLLGMYCDQEKREKALLDGLERLRIVVSSEIKSPRHDSEIWERFRIWLNDLDRDKARYYEAYVDPEKIKYRDYCDIVAIQLLESIEGIQKTTIYADLNKAIVKLYGPIYKIKITAKSFGDAVTTRQKENREKERRAEEERKKLLKNLK